MASVGTDGAFLVGTPTAASTQQISRALAGRTKSPFRYVVIAPQDPIQSEGDAVWQRRGAFVAMHENALQRGDVMGAPPPPLLSSRHLGHAVVLVRLRADGCRGPGEPESVCLYIPVEAGSIDSFVAKARSIDETKGAKAYLHMADHTVGWVQRNFPSIVTFSIPTWR